MSLIPSRPLLFYAGRRSPAALKLPADVLRIIFFMLTWDYFEECRTILHSHLFENQLDSLLPRTHPLLVGARYVCRDWYYITSSTPLLWTSVLATPIIVKAGSGEYAVRRKRWNTTNLVLRLSANMPISLHMIPNHTGSCLYYDHFENPMQTPARIFKLDLDAYITLIVKNAMRCTSLSISYTDTHRVELFEQCLLSPEVCFPILDTLTISVVIGFSYHWETINYKFDLQILLKFPALKHLHIVSGGSPIERFYTTNDQWSDGIPEIHHSQLGDLRTFAAELPGLFPTIAIDLLRYLNTAKSISLGQAHQRTVHIPSSPISEPAPTPLSRPSVTRLVLSGCYCPELIFEQFIFPNLRFLEVNFVPIQNLHNPLILLLDNSQCKLTDLKIRHSGPAYGDLMSFLLEPAIRSIPNVSIKYQTEWFFRTAPILAQRARLTARLSSLNLEEMRRIISPSFHYRVTSDEMSFKNMDNYTFTWGTYSPDHKSIRRDQDM